MRLRVLLLVILPCLLLVAACARTVHAPPAALTPTPPDTPVLLLRTAPPPAVRYQLIGPVVVCKTPGGSADWALNRLADAARLAGATAIMHVRVYVGPSWGGWAPRRGTGMAIRILEPSAAEVSQLPTVQAEWR